MKRQQEIKAVLENVACMARSENTQAKKEEYLDKAVRTIMAIGRRAERNCTCGAQMNMTPLCVECGTIPILGQS